ncbi:Chromate resistance protein ChrB [Kineococcus glutinatus]
MPREPSTPRIAVWRRLKRCGVVQLGDGLVALPADARTREQLEWVAEEVTEAAGTAGVWLARPASAAQERALAQEMSDARAAEYTALTEAAGAALALGPGERLRALRRLRAQWRELTRRDFFPPAERDTAAAALRELADAAQRAGQEVAP